MAAAAGDAASHSCMSVERPSSQPLWLHSRKISARYLWQRTKLSGVLSLPPKDGERCMAEACFYQLFWGRVELMILSHTVSLWCHPMHSASGNGEEASIGGLVYVRVKHLLITPSSLTV